jgi:CRISPR-associated protein Csx10
MSTLTLTLRQAAQLGDRPREDFVLSTLEHIPGSVVRGAFAAAWIRKNGPPESGLAEFRRLFEGGVRFGTLLRPGTEFDSLAVLRHKYPHAGACQVPDYDRAVLAAGDGRKTGRGEPPLNCPQCHSPLEPGRGIRRDGEPDRAEKRRRTSVAIGESGVAVRGQLFTRETLRPRESFTGTLVAENPADLELLRGIGPVRVGGRRTTHGLAEVSIAAETRPPEPRLLNGGQDLVLRLRSPGIFTDSFGRPRPEPDETELERALGVPAAVSRSWTRWEETGGWHVASGLPKPSEMTVAAGSTFLIHTERIIPPEAVTALSLRGVGLRRHEGFGDLAGPPAIRLGLKERQQEEQRRRQKGHRP